MHFNKLLQQAIFAINEYDLKFKTTTYNEIFKAILNNDLEKAKKCIRKNKSHLQQEKNFGITGVHLAALNNFRILQLLLENNADSNCLSKKKETPLHFALMATIPNSILIHYLINTHNADLNIKNDRKETPIELAFKLNKLEEVRVMFQLLKDNGSIDVFIKNEQKEFLINKAIELDSHLLLALSIDFLNVKINHLLGALALAFEKSYFITCRFIIIHIFKEVILDESIDDIKAVSNWINYSEISNLYRQSEAKQKKVLQLIYNDTKSNMVATEGNKRRALLFESSEKLDIKTALSLIKNYNLEYVKSPLGWSVLFYASSQKPSREKFEFISTILENVNYTDTLDTSPGGSTLAHRLATTDDILLMQYIDSLGIDLNRVTQNGESPLDYAINFNSKKVFQFMLEKGNNKNLYGSLKRALTVKRYTFAAQILEIIETLDFSIIQEHLYKAVNTNDQILANLMISQLEKNQQFATQYLTVFKEYNLIKVAQDRGYFRMYAVLQLFYNNCVDLSYSQENCQGIEEAMKTAITYLIDDMKFQKVAFVISERFLNRKKPLILTSGCNNDDNDDKYQIKESIPQLVAQKKVFVDLYTSKNKLSEIGYTSSILIGTKSNVIGYLLIKCKPPVFNVYQYNFLEMFAKRLRTVFEDLRHYELHDIQTKRIKQEYDLAQQIQLNLLPSQTPQMNNVNIETHCHSSLEVGGDYYDFFSFSKHKLGVVILDVVGKGIPAAMNMIHLKGLLHRYIDKDQSPKEFMEIINKIIYLDNAIQKFVPLFYGIFDTQENTFTYSNTMGNAGGIFQTQNGKTTILEEGGFMLGAYEYTDIAQEVIHYKKNDRFLFFTDGIVEQTNLKNKQFGIEEILSAMRNIPEKKSTIDALLARLNKFQGSAPQDDDLTLIGVQIN